MGVLWLVHRYGTYLTYCQYSERVKAYLHTISGALPASATHGNCHNGVLIPNFVCLSSESGIAVYLLELAMYVRLYRVAFGILKGARNCEHKQTLQHATKHKTKPPQTT